MSFASIMAHMVGLASGFYISVHARHSWNVATMEAGGRHLVISWVIMTGYAGDFIQILFFLLLMRLTIMGLAVMLMGLLQLGMVERSMI